MVTFTAGAVVLVRFPFSDLSQTKLRPAVVLADAGRGDWILCQVSQALRRRSRNKAGRHQLLRWVVASPQFCPSRQTLHRQSGSHGLGGCHTEVAIVETSR